MFNRIVAVKDAVISTLSLTKPDLSLALEDWQVLEELTPVLEPFYEVTKDILAEKNVTVLQVLVLCNLLESVISVFNPTKNQIKLLISVMKREITNRLGGLQRSSFYAESTILDPRFKKLGFKNESS